MVVHENPSILMLFTINLKEAVFYYLESIIVITLMHR